MLYIVGRFLHGGDVMAGMAWDFEGVYAEAQRAIDECILSEHFVMEVELGVAIDPAMMPGRAWYPSFESREVGISRSLEMFEAHLPKRFVMMDAGVNEDDTNWSKCVYFDDVGDLKKILKLDSIDDEPGFIEIVGRGARIYAGVDLFSAEVDDEAVLRWALSWRDLSEYLETRMDDV